MQENDMYTREALEIAERFQRLIRGGRLLSNEKIKEINEQLEHGFYKLLRAPKPKVMVYGIYNSGKSTLVNALCGKAVAEVRDRPMTWKTDEYDVGKYVLIDSPGVDAPIEHEQVADAQLTKCHVILFVISAKGGFESRTNYEKMLHLIELNIPFYIILNDRGTELPKDIKKREAAKRAHLEEIHEIKRKIIRNLINISGDQRIGEKYEVIDLNAKRAWDGIEKGKPKMVEASKVPLLHARIEHILEDKGAMKWLQAPLTMLDGCIQAAESAVIAQQGNIDYAKKRQQLIQQIETSRQNRIEGLQDCVNRHRLDAYHAFSGSGNQNSLAEEIIQDIESAAKKELETISCFIQENFPDLGLQVDKDLRVKYQPEQSESIRENYNNQASQNEFNYDTIDFDNDEDKSAFSKIVGSFAGIIANPFSLSNLGSEAGSLLRELLKQFKSREKKEQEKYERLCAEVEAANRMVEDQVAERIRFMQDARMQAYAYLDKLRQEMQKMVLSGMDSACTLALQALDAAVQSKQQINREAGQLLIEFRQLRNRLSKIRRVQLGGSAMTLLQNTEMDSVEYLVGHDLVQRWCGMEMKLSNKDIITIANTGLVNAGKSSLFNALLDEYEQERFKVGPVRTTTQGKRAHLNDWVDILDTPGIDVTEGDDEEAFRSLTESDLIIAVHNIKLGMLNRAEYEWLKALAGRMSKEEIERKIIFVCTWIDERERQDGYRSAVEETRRQAYESLGTNRIPFMEVSAKRYILGMKKNNPALLKASRLPEFKAFLLKRADEARAFIDAQRGHELMALCRETREKLSEQKRELQNIVREQEEVVQRRHQPALDNWKYTLENFVFSRDRVEDKLKALLWEGESSDDIQLFRSNLNRM